MKHSDTAEPCPPSTVRRLRNRRDRASPDVFVIGSRGALLRRDARYWRPLTEMG